MYIEILLKKRKKKIDKIFYILFCNNDKFFEMISYKFFCFSPNKNIRLEKISYSTKIYIMTDTSMRNTKRIHDHKNVLLFFFFLLFYLPVKSTFTRDDNGFFFSFITGSLHTSIVTTLQIRHHHSYIYIYTYIHR